MCNLVIVSKVIKSSASEQVHASAYICVLVKLWELSSRKRQIPILYTLNLLYVIIVIY